MDSITIDHTTSARPSEDDVCRGLRLIDPFGPEVVVTLPEEVLAKILTPYQAARDAWGTSRTRRRAALRSWANTVETTVRAVRSGVLTW